jgi:hypothetical protein
MNKVFGKKKIYLLSGILLFCIILSVFLLMELNNKELTNSSNFSTTESVPENLDQGFTSLQNTSNPSTKPENSSFIARDEALSLAMPYITQYATEHERNITTINATFDPSAVILNGSRGPSFTDLKTPNLQWHSYPVWHITASFQQVDDEENAEHWVTGYSVCIYADDGEIANSQPYGII